MVVLELLKIEKSFFEKLTALIAIPAIFLLTLTMPVVETNDLNSEGDEKDDLMGGDQQQQSLARGNVEHVLFRSFR